MYIEREEGMDDDMDAATSTTGTTDTSDTIEPTSIKSSVKKRLCLRCKFRSNIFAWCNSCRLRHFKIVYGRSPSEDEAIDNILKESYEKISRPDDVIEWIAYTDLYDVTNILDERFTKTFSAKWRGSIVCEWDKDKYNWTRKQQQDLPVTLKYYQNLNDFRYHLRYNYSLSPEERQNRNIPSLYGATRDPMSYYHVLVFSDAFSHSRVLCIRCQFLRNFFNWCEDCRLKHFNSTYGENPTDNNRIVEILKHNYVNSKDLGELIEWVNYTEFKQVISVEDGGSFKMYDAIRTTGFIRNLDYNRLSWARTQNVNVTLKSFENVWDLLEEYGHNVNKIQGISQETSGSGNYILMYPE